MAARRRTFALAAAFLLVACGVQALAPRPTVPAESTSPDAPRASATPTSTPVPTIATADLLYVRGWPDLGGSWSDGSGIVLLEARTGAAVRGMTGGILSRDRARVYATELVDGGTRTTVHINDVASGRELRTFAVEGGGYHLVFGNNNSPTGLSVDDDRWLTLAQNGVMVDGAWEEKLVVVGTKNPSVASRIELRSDRTYSYFGISPNGTWVYLTEYGGGGTRLRVWDVRKAALVQDGALGASWDGTQNGYVVGPLSSADGRWLYTIDSGGNGAGPVVRALDTAATDAAPGKMARVALPADQLSDDFEKYMLWSLVLTRDGRTLYAVNPALGAIDEIDATRMELRRSSHIRVSRADEDVPLAWLGRSMFPLAEAKRALRAGAVLSPDERRLYAVGGKGVAVIDTASLRSGDPWIRETEVDDIALSPDGARLYAISDTLRRILVLDTATGGSLGMIDPKFQAQAIIRIDAR